MADFGTIGKQRDHYGITYDPLSYTGADVRVPMAQNSVISGTASINGTPVAGVEVWLLWRPTMAAIKKTISAADGTYSFTNVGTPTTEYVVYFKDSAGGTAFNDLVYALVDTTV